MKMIPTELALRRVQFVDDLAAAELQWAAKMVAQFGMSWNAECRKEGRSEIVRREGPRGWQGADGVGTTNRLTALYASASKQSRVDFCPMISADFIGPGYQRDRGGAAELACHHDHGFFEQSRPGEIVQEGRQPAIKRRK